MAQPWIQSEIESRKEFFKEIQDLQTTFGLTKEQSCEVVTPQGHRDHSSSATPKTAFPLYVQVGIYEMLTTLVISCEIGNEREVACPESWHVVQ